MRLATWDWKPCDWRAVVLHVEARPAERGHGMAIGAAGMDADRQAVALRCGVERPEMPAPERHLAHRQHQHLDEAWVGGEPLDLLDGELDVLQRHHDRGAQARIAVEPFPRDPVVDRAGEGARHVLVEGKLDAIETIADREARAPAVEHLGAERARRRSPAACRAPGIRPRRDRRIGRIGDAVQPLDAAIDDLVAPERLKIGQQRLDAGHRRVHVAIDRFHRGGHGGRYLASRRRVHNACSSLAGFGEGEVGPRQPGVGWRVRGVVGAAHT